MKEIIDRILLELALDVKRIGNPDDAIDTDKALRKAIQSAILAEREACAKICDDARLRLFKERREYTNSREYRIQADCVNELAARIRARSVSNPLPVSPETGPDSSESLQSASYPASVLKT